MVDHTAETIVKCVDHLTVRALAARPLFNALVNDLGLPQAWPLTTNPFYTSGGVSLGNINLEVMEAQAHPARLYGIAFELTPFEESLPILDERRIPHTPPLPFYVLDDQGWQVTAWTTVFLGGLFHDGPLASMFFALSRRAAPDTWERGTLPTSFNRRFGQPFVFDRVFHTGMVQAVAYNPVWRAANIQQVQAIPVTGAAGSHAPGDVPVSAGLEVLRVFELSVSTRSPERAMRRWDMLLRPHPRLAAGTWLLPEGLHLHLLKTKNGPEGLRRIILQVASLNRAAHFLHRRGMLGEEKNGMIRILSDKLQGLDIRLVQ
jgi:hypothetical protein